MTPVGSQGDGDDDARISSDGFLMRAGYALDSAGPCISDARRHAAAFLDRARAEHDLTISERARDLTALVVSELVTNALKYAPGPIVMELRIGTDNVEIVVWDSDPVVPAVLAADPGRVGRHGMEIVKAVTTSLFIEQEPAGKRVTARIALADTPSLA